MKVKIHNRKSFNYIAIVFISLVFSIPLFSKNLNIYNNMGYEVIAKAYEFTKNFQANEGRIFSSFFYYLGTGNMLFEAPLATILLSLGNYIFSSYVFTYKLLIFFSILLSGIYMHKFTDKITNNKNISLLASILYMGTPIHLGQIYFSNCLESALIFVFLPMVFYGLYKLFNTTENNFHIAFGIIGIILTDFRFGILLIFAIFIYFLINKKNLQLEFVRKSIFINVLAIISITAFCVFPYIQTIFFTKYVGVNNTFDEFLNSRANLKMLFVTDENSKTVVELGMHIIIMLAFSFVSIHKLKEQDGKEYKYYFSMMIIYILLGTKLFPWGLLPQFVGRLEEAHIFLIIASFFECYICAVNMSNVLKKFELRDVFIISVISCLFIFALNGFIPYKEQILDVDNYNLSDIIDYKVIPQNAKDNIEYLKNRSSDVEVLNGNSNIYEKNKYLTYYTFKADTLKKNTIYEFPYLYYPGYEIRYDGMYIDYFESENGLVAIKMDPEDGTLFELKYVGTDLMRFCKALSFIGVWVFGIYVYKKH